MKWSKDKPTQKGLYWYKEELGQDPTIKELESFGGLLCFSIGDKQTSQPNKMNGWWYGPIEPPKEKTSISESDIYEAIFTGKRTF